MFSVIKRTLKVSYRQIECIWIYQNEKSIENVLSNQIKKDRIK